MLKTAVLILVSIFMFSLSAAAQTPERLVSVPDINGRAVELVKPAFPERAAMAVGGDGTTVTLKVVVDESGNVVSAQCSLTCHPMLKDAAELAAITSKFRPLLIDGRAVKYDGNLLYTFVVERVNWYGFGMALESTRQFDNISFGPVANILSKDFAAEKAVLNAMDANGGVDYDGRQKGIAEVEASIRSKLKGIDLWRFELAMAIRRVTFWMNAGRIDRGEMQKAIDALPPVIASAPEGVPEQVIADLTAFSKFRIPAEMSDRDLQKTIFEMSRKIPNDPK